MFVLLGVETDPDFKLKGLKYKRQKKKKNPNRHSGSFRNIYI